MTHVPESIRQEFRERAASLPPVPNHVAVQLYRIARAAASRQRTEHTDEHKEGHAA